MYSKNLLYMSLRFFFLLVIYSKAWLKVPSKFPVKIWKCCTTPVRPNLCSAASLLCSHRVLCASWTCISGLKNKLLWRLPHWLNLIGRATLELLQWGMAFPKRCESCVAEGCAGWFRFVRRSSASWENNGGGGGRTRREKKTCWKGGEAGNLRSHLSLPPPLTCSLALVLPLFSVLLPPCVLSFISSFSHCHTGCLPCFIYFF